MFSKKFLPGNLENLVLGSKFGGRLQTQNISLLLKYN